MLSKHPVTLQMMLNIYLNDALTFSTMLDQLFNQLEMCLDLAGGDDR